jgi:hypothetical protein
MIELTQEQRQAVIESGNVPVRLTDPDTHREFVLIQASVFQRLQDLYDDSPWTDEEMELLAWEAGKSIGWEEMDEYDRYPEKP